MKLVDPKQNDKQAISSGDFKRTFAVGLRYKGLRNLVYIYVEYLFVSLCEF